MITAARQESNVFTIVSAKGIFQKLIQVPIEQCLIISDRVLARFKSPSEYGSRNIVCFNESADMVWQIQDPDINSSDLPKTGSSFTEMRMNEDGKVFLSNGDSHAYEINLGTGKLMNAAWTEEQIIPPPQS